MTWSFLFGDWNWHHTKQGVLKFTWSWGQCGFSKIRLILKNLTTQNWKIHIQTNHLIFYRSDDIIRSFEQNGHFFHFREILQKSSEIRKAGDQSNFLILRCVITKVLFSYTFSSHNKNCSCNLRTPCTIVAKEYCVMDTNALLLTFAISKATPSQPSPIRSKWPLLLLYCSYQNGRCLLLWLISLTFPPPFALLKKSNKYQHTTATTVLWVLKVCVQLCSGGTPETLIRL